MKKLLSVISILLLILVIGSVSSLATELNSDNEAESGTVQIGSTNSNKSSPMLLSFKESSLITNVKVPIG